MSLTAEEVEHALNEIVYDYGWDDLDYYLRNHNSRIEVDEVYYDVEVLEEETGGEGDWDVETYVVFKVGDQVFRKTGRYQSHYGNDWDGPLQEVRPVKKIVQVWEAK